MDLIDKIQILIDIKEFDWIISNLHRWLFEENGKKDYFDNPIIISLKDSILVMLITSLIDNGQLKKALEITEEIWSAELKVLNLILIEKKISSFEDISTDEIILYLNLLKCLCAVLAIDLDNTMLNVQNNNNKIIYIIKYILNKFRFSDKIERRLDELAFSEIKKIIDERDLKLNELVNEPLIADAHFDTYNSDKITSVYIPENIALNIAVVLDKRSDEFRILFDELLRAKNYLTAIEIIKIKNLWFSYYIKTYNAASARNDIEWLHIIFDLMKSKIIAVSKCHLSELVSFDDICNIIYPFLLEREIILLHKLLKAARKDLGRDYFLLIQGILAFIKNKYMAALFCWEKIPDSNFKQQVFRVFEITFGIDKLNDVTIANLRSLSEQDFNTVQEVRKDSGNVKEDIFSLPYKFMIKTLSYKKSKKLCNVRDQ